MTGRGTSARLHVDAPLRAGNTLSLDRARTHYLRHVMRRRPGDAALLFNASDGEWRASILSFARDRATLAIETQLRAPRPEPDLWLLCAPIKRTAIDFLAAKATELGVSAIQPVFTQRTVVSRVNTSRMAANCIEAAEQCQRLGVPQVFAPAPLDRVLESCSGRRLMLCDESGAGAPIAAALDRERVRMPEPWAILIGPEGGFTELELERIAALPGVLRVSLGARLLRADTAALAALALWQATLGEWQE